MGIVAPAMDALFERASSQSAWPARPNRWGAPIWPGDEPVVSRPRFNDDPLPFEVWMLAVVYGASCN